MPTDAIRLPYRFAPRSYQRRVFAAYDRGIRRLLLVWHRRSGKDKTLLNLLVREMMRRVGNYGYVFPLLKDARETIWRGIDREGNRYLEHFPTALIHSQDSSSMTVTLRHPQNLSQPGSTFSLYGSDKNVNVLVGKNPIAVIFSEYSLQNPRAWDLTRPILRENGGWAAFCYTPRGKNHGYGLYQANLRNPEWYVELLTRQDTRRDGPGEDGQPIVTDRDIARDLAEGMEESLALQEYDCSWTAPMPGAYYDQELRRLDADGRLRHVPYDPALPTYTAWDLGHNDCNALWYFQLAGHEVRFIDYEEGSSIALAQGPGEGLHDNWIGRVRAKPYVYDHAKLPVPLTREGHEVHYGPHDLHVHEYSYGKDRYTIALRHGLRFTVLPQGPVEDGIAAARQLLGRSVFDAVKCARGIEALRSYRRVWDDHKKVYLNTPLHDWASNGSDAYRYAAVGLMPPPQPPATQPPPGSFAAVRQRALKAHRSRYG